MPKIKKKESKGTSENKKVGVKSSKKKRAGLPDEESILEEVPFTSPKGKIYKIIKTTEKDAYDKNQDSEDKPE